MSRPYLLALLLFLAAFPLHAQQNLTANLLANPGAELGSIANWNPVDATGTAGDGTPTVDAGTFDGGINPHTGTYDFLGQSGGTGFLSQTVYLGNLGISAATLDSGTVNATISFWEQGLSQGTPSDDASVTLRFTNGDAVFGTVTTAEVDSHDGTWQHFTGSYPIPAGTRYITYTMNFIRHAGSDLDAFVDDNSLILTTTASTAGLTVTPTSLAFGNQTVGVTSTPQAVTVTNTTSATVDIANISLNIEPNPGDFAQTNNCPAALAPNASCTLSITFTPQGVGPKSSAAEIDDDANPSFNDITLSGTGTGGILAVDPGNLKTLAGTGTVGNTGDGGPATAAQLGQPGGVAFDPAGNLYITDLPNNLVRKVTPAGIISTFAGTGVRGYTGDGGPATAAQLYQPFSVTADVAGNVFIDDTGNNVVRKVTPAGIITTIAGTGAAGHLGDGGPATSARFNQPQGSRIDKSGNLYVAQCGGPSVRKITSSGTISTIAGTFVSGFSGDGGQATAAQLACPSAVAIDPAGNIFIADYLNQRIRKVDPTGIITTVAGNGAGTFSGDGGPATAASLNLPNDVTLDAAGNLYIADSGNNRIRKVDPTGIITTLAGGLQNAGSAIVNTPLALTTDASGDLVFSDSGNAVVRQFFPTGTTPFPPTAIAASATPQTLTLRNIGNLNVAIANAQSFTLSGNTADFSLTGGTCLVGVTLAPAATCTLQVAFTPTAAGLRTVVIAVADTALNSPQSFTLSGAGVAPVIPTLTWPSPAPIAYGIPLGAAQLNASATSGTAPVPGTFTYTPAAGTILTPGTQTLSVAFTPTDTLNFAPATASVQLTVTSVALTAITPSGVPLGAPATTLTLTGSGFVTSSVAQVNGATLATTYVNPTTLTAVVPAANFTQSGTLAITVLDPTITATSALLTLTVTPATPSITVTGPSTTAPGSQPSLAITITNPYPLDLTATFALSFAGTATPSTDDPAIQFAAGGRTLTLRIPANSTVVPPIQLQAGTVAGTITIPIVLTAAGANVTPTSLTPIVIVVPRSVPTLSTVTLTRNTGTLTVAIHGFSNTREVTTANFHFVPAPGANISTPDLTAPVTTPFTTWFTSPQSPAFGSTFTYTQIFNISDDAKNIGSVQVTLTNSVGPSALQAAQ